MDVQQREWAIQALNDPDTPHYIKQNIKWELWKNELARGLKELDNWHRKCDNIDTWLDQVKRRPTSSGQNIE